MTGRTYLERNNTGDKKISFLFEQTGYKKTYKNSFDVLSKKKCDYLFSIVKKVEEKEDEIVIAYEWPAHYQTI